MVFSSNIFLFLFLPFFLGCYYLTPLKWRSLTILIGSYVFYGWWRIDFLALFAGVTLWNYALAKLTLKHADTAPIVSRRWMQLGVAGNLFTLGVFKYFNFGVESLSALLDPSAANSIETLRFILPIGISFYIFQSISFLIDIYRKDTPPPRHFLDFAAFISLFPQLIAGPVLRYKDLAPQFEKREHSRALFAQGAYRFMIGFTQKVLIADTLARLVDASFALENPTMGDAWLGALAYTLQLFFDFSGYSHMAIGLGLMMGFRFMENFNAPYISRSITEFWQRWHMSLSTWLKDYLYIPLGGNRRGRVRTIVNLMLTMVLGGLWHGANWTFVLWGAWHGVLLSLERAIGVKKANSAHTRHPVGASADPELARTGSGKCVQQIFRPYRSPLFKHILRYSAGMMRGGITFFLIVLGWIMFRAENISQAFDFYKAMAGFNGYGISDALAWQISGLCLSALIIGYILVWGLPLFEYKTRIKIRNSHAPCFHIPVIALFLLAIIKLSAQSYSPFLYFQF